MKKLLFFIVLIGIFACSPVKKSRSIGNLDFGTGPNTGTGMSLRAFALVMQTVIDDMNRRGTTEDLTTADERNILHNLDPNLVYIGDIAVMKTDTLTIIPTIHSAAGDTSNYQIPGKIGNIYIDTSTGDVYISVKAIRHDGWKKLN